MDKIKRKGVRYLRNMKHEKNSSYLTWQSTFETKSKEVSKSFPTDSLPLTKSCAVKLNL